MIKIAITGNIASGKSEVQSIIESQGYSVLDTDIEGHKILKSEVIKSAFEKYDVFDDNGDISREKLGRLVFSSKELKSKLEEISHPKIREEILKFFNSHAEEKLVFVAIPLVYETGMENLFDKILLVYTDDEIRKQRLIERNGYTDDYADLRINCQMPQEEKRNMADYIITNNKSKTDLEFEVYKFLKSF